MEFYGFNSQMDVCIAIIIKFYMQVIHQNKVSTGNEMYLLTAYLEEKSLQ